MSRDASIVYGSYHLVLNYNIKDLYKEIYEEIYGDDKKKILKDKIHTL